MPDFRAIWSANFVSKIGTLMQTVGAAWLMTSLTTSPVLVGLVQTASALPVFLLGLFAGALADVVNRRTLLLVAQLWMLAAAALLGLLTWLGWTTPWVLLGLTCALGLGAAVSLPAWQATVQDLVPKEWVPSAVSLNSIAVNVARSVGPALGGFVVAAAGAAAVFFVNALSFVAVLGAVARWKPAPAPPRSLRESLWGATRAGLRYLFHAPRLQAPVFRTAVYTLCAGAVWPLLPLLARDVLQTDATGYGLLLGAFGLGSVFAGLALSRLRALFALDQILDASSILAAVCFVILSVARDPLLAGAMLFGAGASWVAAFINFNVAVQMGVPTWVRGRALSIYLLAFQGVLALDGALWGWLAGAVGISECFAVAAAGLALSLLSNRFVPLAHPEGLDFGPPQDWPYEHHSALSDPDEGPVLVTVEYFIASKDAAEFHALMRQLRKQRLRDGAHVWRLYHDMEQPERFLEVFKVRSWGEHLLQHERMTMDDMPVRTALLRLHRGPDLPKTTHLLQEED